MSTSESGPDGPEALTFDCELAEPPAKVWRALTTPALVAEWLTAADEAQTADEPIECELIDSERERRVRYAWQRGEEPWTLVTLEISPTRTGGTHLTLTHGELPAGLFAPVALRAAA